MRCPTERQCYVSQFPGVACSFCSMQGADLWPPLQTVSSVTEQANQVLHVLPMYLHSWVIPQLKSVQRLQNYKTIIKKLTNKQMWLKTLHFWVHLRVSSNSASLNKDKSDFYSRPFFSFLLTLSIDIMGCVCFSSKTTTLVHHSNYEGNIKAF